MSAARDFETAVYSAANKIVEPLIIAGLGSTSCWSPFGATVMEIVGRKTGKLYRVPALAASLGDLTIVSTIRPKRSQWIRNLAANPEIRFWKRGKLSAASAYVFNPESTKLANESLPSPVRNLAETLQLEVFSSMAFAILAPHQAGRAQA
jgi:deazaflavin-dependent oxidoreductase (nitroreductase family)